MCTCRLTHTGTIEVGTLYKNARGSIRYTALGTAKNPCHAEGVVPGIANHDLTAIQFALYTIEGGKLGTLGEFFYMNFPSCNLICIKEMERLPYFVKDKIGNIHQETNRANTDSSKTLAQPLRTLAIGQALHRYTLVARALLGSYIHRNRDRLTILQVAKHAFCLREFGFLGATMPCKVGSKISRHPKVRSGIYPVGRNIHLKAIITL